MTSECHAAEPWWDVLYVSPNATLKEVEEAYRELARHEHPDLWSEKRKAMANTRMKAINAAGERAKEDIALRETRKAAEAAENARKAAAEAAAARQAEEARRAAAEAAAARRAEEERKAAAEAAKERAAARDRAARQEEEDRKAGAAAAEARKTATEAPTDNRTENRTAGRNMPKGPSRLYSALIRLAIFAVLLYAIQAVQTTQAPVRERTTTDARQSVPLSALVNQAHTGELEAKPTAPIPAAENPDNRVRVSGGQNPAGGDTVKEGVATKGAQQSDAADGSGDLIILGEPKASDPKRQLAEQYVQQGLAEAKSGKLEQAIIELTNAIKTDSKYAKAYFNRGATWLLLGKYDIAILDFDRTISLDPNYPLVREHRDLAVQEKRGSIKPVGLWPVPSQ